MARVKSPVPPKKLVWRISERAPKGEWVDPTVTAAGVAGPTDALPEVSSGGWVVSSFDLLNGTDVSECEDDTLPGDLFDELFAAAPSDPKVPRT
jgi:hypothetical protein